MSVLPVFRTTIASTVGAYPTTPVPTRVEEEPRAWASQTHGYDMGYELRVPEATREVPRPFRVRYDWISLAELTVLTDFFKATRGMEVPFVFAHPRTGEKFFARFRRPELTWQYHGAATRFRLFVELEEVIL